MNFFKKLTFKPKLSDITFSKDCWKLHEQTDRTIAWYTDKNDPARIQLFTQSSTWPFDLTQEDKAKLFFEAQSKSFSGAMVEMNMENIHGIRVLKGIFKYRSPVPEHLGIYYVGILWFPFKEFTYQINFESLEQGITGIREAMVVAQEGASNNIDYEEEPILLDTTEALFFELKKKQLHVISSDHQKWDYLFPDHPLSKVRMYLNDFIQNAQINPHLLKQKPYKV